MNRCTGDLQQCDRDALCFFASPPTSLFVDAGIERPALASSTGLGIYLAQAQCKGNRWVSCPSFATLVCIRPCLMLGGQATRVPVHVESSLPFVQGLVFCPAPGRIRSRKDRPGRPRGLPDQMGGTDPKAFQGAVRTVQGTSVSESASESLRAPAVTSRMAVAALGRTTTVGKGGRRTNNIHAYRIKAGEKTGYITSKEELKQLTDTNHTLVVDWMALWCRKCIYLKPKLEKLCVRQGVPVAFVDVNNAPSALVRENGVQHMPTIQVWNQGVVAGAIVGGTEAADVVAKVEKLLDESRLANAEVDSHAS